MKAFSYHRGIAPMVWVLMGLSLVEMLVVHLLLAVWWPALGFALLGLSLAGLLWMAWLLRSLPRHPVLIGEGRILMRIGTLRQAHLPADAIVGLRPNWTAETLKDPAILRLSLLAYPNIVVDLARPVPVGGRQVRAVAHRLDDPEGFARALAELIRR